MKLKSVLALLVLGFSTNANAWFFIFPIPNLSKPPALEKLIDALEKSNEIKAVAYASEDKTFGSKQWIWGYHTNGKTQQESDQLALQKCEATLQNMRNQKVGGQPLYDFGTQSCKLHEFTNVGTTSSPQASTWTSPQSPAQSSVEQRFTDLKSLFEKNLITQEEYDQKRRELLKEIK